MLIEPRALQVGGLGPLAASVLATKIGLAQALLIAPISYILSACVFWHAAALVDEEAEAMQKRKI